MDTYTGATRLGEPAAVRTLPALTIAKLSCSTMDNNAYLLTCAATGRQALIDAADSAPALLRLIGSAGLEVLITTHQHFDHHRALADVAVATGATTIAGEADAAAIEQATGRTIDRRVTHGDTVTFGKISLDVIALRGHTPGSIALAYTEDSGHVHLFTGDSLFPGGVGNTFGNAKHFATLIDDVEKRLFDAYGDETWVYPGHGNDTTLGDERPHLGEWRERGW